MSKHLLQAMLALFFFGMGLQPVFAQTIIDKAGAVGLSYTGPTQGTMVVLKVGVQDCILPSKHGGPWKLFCRSGSTYTARSGDIIRDREDGHGCTAVDVMGPNGTAPDGRTDILCTTGACQGTCTREYHKPVNIQQSNGTFVDVARTALPGLAHARGRAVQGLSLGGGRALVAYANEASQLYPALSINRVFLFESGRPLELPLYNAAGTTVDKTTGFNVILIPRSGALPDIVFASSNATIIAYRYDGSKYRRTSGYGSANAKAFAQIGSDLLVLAGGKLTRYIGGSPSNAVTVTTFSNGHGVAVGDITCDGKPDILVVQGTPANQDILLKNNGNGTFVRITSPQTTNGHGDEAVYIRNADGARHPGFLVTHGLFTGTYPAGPTQLLTSSCTL